MIEFTRIAHCHDAADHSNNKSNLNIIQISSLEPLSHLNPDYKHLEGLVLNNNSLASLSGLETSWVQRNGPSLLDIRNNDIRKVGAVENFLTSTKFYI